MKLVRRLAMAVAVLALVVSCGSERPSSDTSTAVELTGSEQLQFTAKTLDGQDFSGHSLLGKPAVLWFWAPWCPNCQREAPTVAKTAQANPDIRFIGVAAQDEVSAMQEFVSEFNLGFPQLADTDAAVWQRFGVTYQPAYAFIGGDGSVDVVKSGLSEQELAQRVSALAAV